MPHIQRHDSHSKVDPKHDVAKLLADLSDVEQRLLELLGRMGSHLADGGRSGRPTDECEAELVQCLDRCQDRRRELLAVAKGADRPCVRQAQFLESLSQWVLAQRRVLSASQLVERLVLNNTATRAA